VNYTLRFCFLFVACLGVLVIKVNAQDTTRVIKQSTRFVTEADFDRNKEWRQVDTSLNRSEIISPVYKKYILFQDLGNTGSPSRPLLFDIDRAAGFHYAQNPFQAYIYSTDEAKYYNTKTPYTDLSYAQGKQNLIYLTAKYSQNILPRWNIGIDYQRITSQGFLYRQYTSHYNLQFYTAFQNKTKTYTLLANLTLNKALVEESGGITSDSAYATLSGTQKVVSPLLSEPGTGLTGGAETHFKSKAIRLKQYWNFGHPQFQYQDEDTLYDFERHSHLAYTFNAEETHYSFTNTGNSDSILMPNQFYDVGKPTYDSVFYRKLDNKLALSFFNPRTKQLSDSVRYYTSVGISHQLVAVGQSQFARQYQNLILDGTMERMALKDYSLSYAAAGSYVLSGYNAFDFKGEGTIRFRFPLIDVSAHLLIQLYEPDFAFQLYKSNQFIWNNNFNKTKVVKPGVTLSTRNWRHNATIKVNTYTINNWVYADVDATPTQDNGTFSVQTITISKTFQAWRFFFEHELMYQKSFSNNVHLPDFGGMARYYFASSFFKRLQFQLGFAVFYNTAYYGNAYNPTSRLFYLQNNTLIGNYPVLDPYISGVVKTVTFFAKYEHANQDWINSGFYATPHYPITLRTLRLGIRWRFYN
jgi:hypothetical protein